MKKEYIIPSIEALMVSPLTDLLGISSQMPGNGNGGGGSGFDPNA